MALPAWWQSPSGLILPSTVALAQPTSSTARLPPGLAVGPEPPPASSHAPSGLDQIAVYVDEAAIGIAPKGLAELRSRLSDVNVESGILVLARLAGKVWALVGERELQLQLAHELFGEGPALAGIRAFFGSHPNAELVSEQQVFALLRLLLEGGRAGAVTDGLSAEELSTLWHSAIASGSVLESATATATPRPRERDDWLALFVQNGAYNVRAHPLGELARAQEIFRRLARDPTASKSPSYCPLDEWMADDYGFTVEEQFALGFALSSMARAWDEGADAGVGAYISPELVDDLFVKLGWEDRQDAALNLISADRQQLLDQFSASGASPAHVAWETRPFKRHPFFRCLDGSLVLLSPRAVVSWLSEGFHYRLLACAQKRSKGDRKRRVSHRYTAFFGELLEAYALSLVRSSYPGRRATGGGRVYGEQPYGKSGKEKKGNATSDVAVDLGPDLVLIEVTSSRLRADTLLLGSPKLVREDLERGLVKKIGQLDGCIRALEEGTAELPAGAPEVDLGQVERIWPIVASASDLTQNGVLWDFVREHTHGLLAQEKVAPLTLLDFEDLEQLCGWVEAGHPLPGLLARKTAGPYQSLELAMWLRHDPSAPSSTHRPALLNRLWEEAINRAESHIDFSRGAAPTPE